LPAIGLSLVMAGSDADHHAKAADVLAIPDSPWLGTSIGVDRVSVASD
jgi:hypothetical protein